MGSVVEVSRWREEHLQQQRAVAGMAEGEAKEAALQAWSDEEAALRR